MLDHWMIPDGDGELTSRRHRPACGAPILLIGSHDELAAKAPANPNTCPPCADIFREINGVSPTTEGD